MDDGLFDVMEIASLIVTYGMRTYARELLKKEMKDETFERFLMTQNDVEIPSFVVRDNLSKRDFLQCAKICGSIVKASYINGLIY